MKINELIENETPNSHDIKTMIKRRFEISNAIKELDSEKKIMDKAIKQFCIDNNINEPLDSDEYVVELIHRRGSGVWNAQKLEEFLTPIQMEQAYSKRDGYSYIRIIRND